MDNITALESFINFCDDMVIAEESIHGVNSKYKQFQTELKKIKDQLTNEDRIDNLIPLYKKQSSLIDNCISEIDKESKIGIKDVGTIMKYSILPLIFGGVTALAINDKDVEKGNKVAGVAITGLTLTYAISEIKKSTDIKKTSLKILNELKERNRKIIDYFEYAKSQGIRKYSEIKHISRFNKNDIEDKRTDVNKHDIDKVTFNKTMQRVKPNIKDNIQSLPDPKTDSKFKSMDKSRLQSFMAKDIIAFLKKYVSSQTFKTRYKKYLYMIKIEETDYSDPFSITITDYQNGCDYENDITDNSWYYELLEVGKMYIEYRFNNWRGYVWHGIENGDGDEGTLYIN